MDVSADIKRLESKLDALLEAATPARWLSIKRACLYAGMSRNSLMQCINESRIRARHRPVGGWIVDRLSIDEYNSGEAEADLYADLAGRVGL